MKIATTNPTAFDFQGRNVRTVYVHGQPWFIGKDVCEVLGISNTRDALGGLTKGVANTDPLSEISKGAPTLSTPVELTKGARNADPLLDDDERAVLTITTAGGAQKMVCVSESGLYALIFKSRKPEARAFRKWVTNEVLPTLRKTGFYDLGRESMQDKANWEMSRCRSRIALLRELQDLERDPKADVEYLTVADFIARQGIRFDSRVEGMKFARQVQLTCQQVGEWPVKQYRRRNRIPSTLWPEPVLRSCLSLLPPPAQPALPLD